MSLTFEGRVEEEAARPDNQISSKGDHEDLIVSMAQTAADALDSEPHKQQVGQGVDDLGGVDGGIVVLFSSNVRR
jgi:hypothetical protein